MTTSNVSNAVSTLLRRGAIASAQSAKAQVALNEKKAGAYGMFVEAGIAARTLEVMSAECETLFDEIRRTGKVKGDDGKAYSVNAKANKEGDAFLVPMAISSAKSVVLAALELAIPLTKQDGSADSFGSIRKAVQAEQAKRKAETATGDEAIRIRLRSHLEALAGAVAKLEGAHLLKLADALDAAHAASILAPPRTVTVPAAKAEKAAAVAQAA